MNKLQILKSAKEVLTIESKAINDLAKSLNDDFFKAVKSIENLKVKQRMPTQNQQHEKRLMHQLLLEICTRNTILKA